MQAEHFSGPHCAELGDFGLTWVQLSPQLGCKWTHQVFPTSSALNADADRRWSRIGLRRLRHCEVGFLSGREDLRRFRCLVKSTIYQFRTELWRKGYNQEKSRSFPRTSNLRGPKSQSPPPQQELLWMHSHPFARPGTRSWKS